MDKQLSSLLDIVNANSDNQTDLGVDVESINQYHFTNIKVIHIEIFF
jgi:hypothetical protein